MRPSPWLLLLALIPSCYVGPPSEAQGTTLDDGSEGEPADALCPEDEVTASLRRLTAPEYRFTVLDILGIDAREHTDQFPVDPRIDGFDNNASSQTVVLNHAVRYQAAAEWIAARAVDEYEAAAFGCDSTASACVDAFIEQRVPLLWRRPLADGERERLDALRQLADPDPHAAASMVLRAALQSPHMLWRPEPAQAPDDSHAIVTRLSYLLWRSAPDQALHEQATNNAFMTAEHVRATAHAMWLDPRADRGRAAFIDGWLRLARLHEIAHDPDVFPGWSPALASSMHQGVARLADRHTTEGPFLELLDTPKLAVDPLLAPLYGVEGDDTWVDVSFDDDPNRGGLLSTVGILALTSPSDVTSPVHRGVWVREAMLCDPLPPPPADVEALPFDPEAGDKASVLAAHRQDPACAGCHALVDPIGLGLERYDAIGRVRELDEWGDPVVLQGSLPGGDLAPFEGARQLGARLRDDPRVADCLALQMFRWTHGRREQAADDCAIEHTRTVFEQSGRFEDLVIETAVAHALR